MPLVNIHDVPQRDGNGLTTLTEYDDMQMCANAACGGCRGAPQTNPSGAGRGGAGPARHQRHVSYVHTCRLFFGPPSPRQPSRGRARATPPPAPAVLRLTWRVKWTKPGKRHRIQYYLPVMAVHQDTGCDTGCRAFVAKHEARPHARAAHVRTFRVRQHAQGPQGVPPWHREDGGPRRIAAAAVIATSPPDLTLK
jgi:hypothetical protein